ncbi:MAG: antitoxin [Chloroflexota bacterium]|nr:MAG: antitoxin [Chloroflexota bacterium]
MIGRYQALTQRIRQEEQDLERIVLAVERHWKRSLTATADQDAYLNSVALNLHGFYSGLERIFELIAAELDGTRLGGERWHIELLKQMTLDLPKLRPPVLTTNTAARLDEYRKFRHLIRNIYTTNIVPNEMEKLVTGLPALWGQIRQELGTSVKFLDELSHADEED